MRTAQLEVGMWPLLLTIFLAILAMVLACGGGDEAPSAAPSDEIVYGGMLIRAHATDPAGFDPVQDTSIAALDLIAPIFSQLVRVDPEAADGALLAELAERWEVGEDGRSITFHLRQGVQWHDGQPFVADDVVSHFNRVISPPKGLFSSQRAPFLDVVDIQAPDASTVVFHTANPSAGLLRSFAGGHYMVVAKHVMERETAEDPRGLRSNPEALIGTGPFTFAAYQQGSSFRVEKNPNYWDEGKPYLDGIEFFIMKDSAARFAALATGRVHTTPSGYREPDAHAGGRGAARLHGHDQRGGGARAILDGRRLQCDTGALRRPAGAAGPLAGHRPGGVP